MKSRVVMKSLMVLMVAIGLLARPAWAQVRGAPSDDALRIAEAAGLARQHHYRQALQVIEARPFGDELELAASLLKFEIVEAGHLAQSWPILEAALKRHPNDAVVNLKLGLTNRVRGGGALEPLERSWSAAPMPETAYYLGVVLSTTWPDLRRASEFFAKCIAMEQPQGTWRKAAEAALAALAEKKPLPPEPR
jgi:hypothetical protein